MNKKSHFSNGLILGKFWPPHLGHQGMWEFAAQQCEKLLILVEERPDETIPVEARHKIAFETMRHYPHVEVKMLHGDHPQSPKQHPQFWSYWVELLKSKHPEKIDAIFVNDEYGLPLAQHLNCEWVSHDRQRQEFPISGTQIRENPWLNWNFLQASAKKQMNKRIVLLGSESTGKSVLAKKLAQKYQTSYIPEWAEEAIKNGLDLSDHSGFHKIIAGQRQMRDEAISQASRFLIEDSNEITTYIFEETFLGEVSDITKQAMIEHLPDAIILCSPDGVDYIHDQHRDASLSREKMHQQFKNLLDQLSIPYQEISGSYEERFIQASTAIDQWSKIWQDMSLEEHFLRKSLFERSCDLKYKP